MANSYGYLKYMIILFSLVFSLALFNRQEAQMILKKYSFVSLFSFGFVALYLLMYAWYTPIANGNRLVLALFTPTMFTFCFVIFRLFEQQLLIPLSRTAAKKIDLGRVLNLAFGRHLIAGWVYNYH